MKSKLTHTRNGPPEKTRIVQLGTTLTTPLDDAGTTDILNQVLRGADMNLWLVEAHEQEY